jgi:hypothetical protein
MGLESTSSRYHHVGEVEAVAVPIDVRPISDSESESINSKFSSIPVRRYSSFLTPFALRCLCFILLSKAHCMTA